MKLIISLHHKEFHSVFYKRIEGVAAITEQLLFSNLWKIGKYLPTIQNYVLCDYSFFYSIFICFYRSKVQKNLRILCEYYEYHYHNKREQKNWNCVFFLQKYKKIGNIGKRQCAILFNILFLSLLF